MRRVQSQTWRRRRQRLTLVLVSGLSVFFVFSALFAGEPPDSANLETDKSALQPTKWVPRDTTQRGPNPVSLKVLERLNANSVEKWHVSWERFTGLPGIGGGVTKKEYPGDLAERAVAFVDDYKDFFLGIQDSQLLVNYTFEATRTRHDQGRTSIRVQSNYRGVMIWKGYASVMFSQVGKIESSRNYFKPIQLDNVTPGLSLAGIEETIRQAAAPDTLLKPSEFDMMFHNTAEPNPKARAVDELELVIFPSLPPRLVYAGYRCLRGVARHYIVDAHTGEILSAHASENIGKYRDPLPP